jgi:hypothetical protein
LDGAGNYKPGEELKTPFEASPESNDMGYTDHHKT